MSIVLRYVSADRKKSVTKALPALPRNIKVPDGAEVEVINPDTKQKMSLAQYVNSHADKAGEDGKGGDGTIPVVVEKVATWGEAMDWLDSLGGVDGPAPAAATWYDPASANDGREEFLGLDRTTLLIGGLVGGGAAVGAFVLSDSNGPKDKTPPVAPTGLDLAAEDDTGSSSTDNNTKNTSGLTIAGFAEAGSRVEIFDGATSLGTATADGTGAFSLDVSLAAGVHAITATATDLAGNVSARSTILPINVDTTAPDPVSTILLDPTDDLGISNSDRITSRTTALTITGKAASGVIVELFDGTTSLGTATANTNGDWTRDVTLAQGTHSITATTSDAAGNAGTASAPMTVVVDTTAPARPVDMDLDAADDDGTSNTDNITTKFQDLTFSGSAEAGAQIELYDGSVRIGTATAGDNGVFVLDVNLGVGLHQIFARAIDAAGNTGTGSATLLVSVVAAPVSTSVEAADAFVFDDPLGGLDASVGVYPIA